jgi:site-specific DNA-adenine methylase
VKQPLKWPGGKHYLTRQLIALMPAHTHYVEPYAGGLALLLAKPCEGISEVVSDLNRDLTNFWRVLQDPALFRQFKRQVEAVPFSEVEWHDAREILANTPGREQKVQRAVRFFIRCRQSRAGECKDFATLSRNRTRRGMNEQVSAWLAAVEGLPEVHARLQRVVIADQPALDVILSQDGPQTLFYLDPRRVRPAGNDRRAAPGAAGHNCRPARHGDDLGLRLAAVRHEARRLVAARVPAAQQRRFRRDETRHDRSRLVQLSTPTPSSTSTPTSTHFEGRSQCN